ncbi:uncharacterized protein LOC144379224 [Halichoerus grypus]|uniref:uncharacterized protein LOC116636255 n=1 Tax=Phoca vitulina TaxID=9720 RepID=UPI0013965644|nr:uncharacterized protein LOC116636255 [Phoca vitulina]
MNQSKNLRIGEDEDQGNSNGFGEGCCQTRRDVSNEQAPELCPPVLSATVGPQAVDLGTLPTPTDPPSHSKPCSSPAYLAEVELSLNYLDLLAGVAVFTAVLLMLAIGLMWLLTRTYIKKENSLGHNVAPQECLPIAPAFDLMDLCRHLPFNPSQPKSHAKVPDGAQGKNVPQNREVQVWVEQSEKLWGSCYL